MEQNDTDKENKTNRVSIIQMIFNFISEKKYVKALIALIAGLVGSVYFAILIHGVVTMLVRDTFSINTLINSILAITFSIFVIYVLNNK